MTSGEGGFAAPPASGPRLHNLPERRFAVRRHDGDLDTIESTRRPLYQHMIMHELVGGPPVLRFDGDAIDVLVGSTCGFDGNAEVGVEVLPPGPYAVLDYEGPEAGLETAKQELQDWMAAQGHEAAGPLLQIHLMDPIDGDIEQQLQVPLAH